MGILALFGAYQQIYLSHLRNTQQFLNNNCVQNQFVSNQLFKSRSRLPTYFCQRIQCRQWERRPYPCRTFAWATHLQRSMQTAIKQLANLMRIIVPLVGLPAELWQRWQQPHSLCWMLVCHPLDARHEFKCAPQKPLQLRIIHAVTHKHTQRDTYTHTARTYTHTHTHTART